MKFAFVGDHQDVFPVEILCKVHKVSRSGFYAWKGRTPSAGRRVGLVASIREVHTESRAAYGSATRLPGD